MKKIINNRLYDTETARKIGGCDGGEGLTGWTEILYRKRTGEYFLYGEGGPMTKYAVTISDNNWTGGEKIMPLSVEAARTWAEEHLDADDYEAAFGLPDEGDGKVTLCIQIPADLDAIIRSRAAEQSSSLTAYLVGLISDDVK